MGRDLFYFIILQFYLLPIVILISLLISWVVRKTIKKINRHLGYLISIIPIVLLLFFICGLYGISAPYYIFLALALEAFYLEEIFYKIRSIKRSKLIIIIVVTILLYIFLYPKYNTPIMPSKINGQININTYQTKDCECIGFEYKEYSEPNTFCSGIPYSCRPGEKYLPF